MAVRENSPINRIHSWS